MAWPRPHAVIVYLGRANVSCQWERIKSIWPHWGGSLPTGTDGCLKEKEEPTLLLELVFGLRELPGWSVNMTRSINN